MKLIFVSAAIAICLIACMEKADHRTMKNKQQLRDINQVKEEHTAELMALPGVAGVYVGALEDGTPCIGVMVENLTPGLKAKIPKELEGHPVKIEETGKIVPMDRGKAK